MGNAKKMSTDAPKKRGRKPKVAAVETPARHEWNSEHEVGQFLAAMIQMCKYKAVLEVGVFEGETAQWMIQALPHGGQYLGIDIVDYRTERTHASMQEGGKAIDFVLGSSAKELTKLPKKHFDLIFVDGDHSWDAILPEFKLVEMLVADGGVIVYHDTILHEGPRKLVEYAAHYGYKLTTLSTPEVRGLSILQR